MAPVLLTIAASDPLGGAGIQADIATFAACGVHGTSAVTAVTAQSLNSVDAVMAVDEAVVAAQIDGVVAGLGVTGVKTGLLARREIVELVAERVERGLLPAPVVDPVMVDGTGRRFVTDAVEHAYRERLFAVARVLTPNRHEAELLAGVALRGPQDVLEHADRLRSLGAGAVVVTGGAFDEAPDNVVITSCGDAWVEPGERITTRNVRGSGCTFSAALAASLATGAKLDAAVAGAARFVRRAIEESASWNLSGAGPVSHALRPPTLLPPP